MVERIGKGRMSSEDACAKLPGLLLKFGQCKSAMIGAWQPPTHLQAREAVALAAHACDARPAVQQSGRLHRKGRDKDPWRGEPPPRHS